MEPQPSSALALQRPTTSRQAGPGRSLRDPRRASGVGACDSGNREPTPPPAAPRTPPPGGPDHPEARAGRRAFPARKLGQPQAPGK